MTGLIVIGVLFLSILVCAVLKTRAKDKSSVEVRSQASPPQLTVRPQTLPSKPDVPSAPVEDVAGLDEMGLAADPLALGIDELRRAEHRDEQTDKRQHGTGPQSRRPTEYPRLENGEALFQPLLQDGN